MNHDHDTDSIQDAELAILQVLWEAAEPLPLSRILEILRARRGWADSTVKTLLRRLQQKGAVTLPRRGCTPPRSVGSITRWPPTAAFWKSSTRAVPKAWWLPWSMRAA